jgi:prepilin-type processing-associated H-X9-DG protein
MSSLKAAPLREPQDVRRFGSAHGQGCHFALCDGSVRFVSYNVNPEVHRHLGHRKDGAAVSEGAF